MANVIAGKEKVGRPIWLKQGSLETVLAEPGLSYDLILAADTVIYIGDLVQTLAGVEQRLVPGGFCLFSCESKDGEGWERTPAGRFRHSESYLRTQSLRAGLEFVDMMECSLRTERGQPVPGFAVAFKKANHVIPIKPES